MIQNVLQSKQAVKEQTVVVSIVIYLFLNMLADDLGILNVSDHNGFRRLTHMFNRLSMLSNSMLEPYCETVPKLLEADELDRLKQMTSLTQLDESKDLPFASRSGTSTIRVHQMTSNDQSTVSSIEDALIPRISTVVGTSVHRIQGFSVAVYRYYGDKSKHDWHVDPCNVKTTINVVICIGRQGEISPFQHKDRQNNVISHELFEGDGVVFAGGVTVHRVPPNNDKSSVRTVLVLAFTTDACFRKPDTDLCTYINGGKNRAAILNLGARVALVAAGTYRLSGVGRHISLKTALTSAVGAAIFARVFPRLDLKVGTGRPVEIKQSIIVALACMALSFSVKGGSLFFVYYMLTDQIFDVHRMRYL